MPTYHKLRRLFRTITATGLAATGAACVGSSGPPGGDVERPFDRTSFAISLCGDVPFDPVAAITPATPVDSLALRRNPWGVAPDGGVFPSTDVLVVGTPCASATDVPTCMAALEALPTGGGWNGASGPEYPSYDRVQFVFTRGDAVGAIGTHAELVAFASPIDSAGEAATLAIYGPDVQPVFRVDCSAPNARVSAEGFELILASGITCGASAHRDEHRVLVRPDGSVTILETRILERGDPFCVIGRLTDGVFLPQQGRSPLDSPQSLGARLAEMASLEAAAVVAFERLARELETLDAPSDLIARARRSARDEVRHARMVGAMAARRGGVVAPIEVRAHARRDTLTIAVENAVEGTVRETYGAVVATHQAEAARDPELARLFAGIARDETRHAALSLDLARWLDTQLSASERELVRSARAEAASALGAELAHGTDDALGASLGLPDAARATQLFAATFPRVWS